MGTTWVARAEGATIGYLLGILRQDWHDSWAAISHLQRLAKASRVGVEHRTNLALSGGALSVYDIERIAQAE